MPNPLMGRLASVTITNMSVTTNNMSKRTEGGSASPPPRNDHGFRCNSLSPIDWYPLGLPGHLKRLRHREGGKLGVVVFDCLDIDHNHLSTGRVKTESESQGGGEGSATLKDPGFAEYSLSPIDWWGQIAKRRSPPPDIDLWRSPGTTKHCQTLSNAVKRSSDTLPCN